MNGNEDTTKEKCFSEFVYKKVDEYLKSCPEMEVPYKEFAFQFGEEKAKEMTSSLYVHLTIVSLVTNTLFCRKHFYKELCSLADFLKGKETEEAVSLILGKRRSESAIASMADGLEADARAFRERALEEDFSAFCAFRGEVRYFAYTNNRIEAFNSEIKRAAKKHIQWAKEEAEERFLTSLANYYSLRKWRRRVKCWRHLDDPLA